MKVAVYSIALNEEKHVERWAKSAEKADYLLIADTGSTDSTVEIAKSLGINVFDVSVKPWRFDDARNASLALIPADIDYCIALDLDEVLIEGWREELEKAFEMGITKPKYRFVTSFNPDGSVGTEFDGFRIHSRWGYRWKYPIHELPVYYGSHESTQKFNFEIHHLPDNTKSRGQYMPLLKMAVNEDPTSDRNSFYYARELYYARRYEESIVEFKRHLSLPSAWWKPERANSMRMLGEMDKENAIDWFMKSMEESPGRREPIVSMAQHFYDIGDHERGLYWAEKALEITEKPTEYFCEQYAWGGRVYDIAALCAHFVGKKDLAIKYGEIALKYSPGDERLIKNIEFYNAMV
jgi:glycosyltransferase involved in cell wall biosynthesis